MGHFQKILTDTSSEEKINIIIHSYPIPEQWHKHEISDLIEIYYKAGFFHTQFLPFLAGYCIEETDFPTDINVFRKHLNRYILQHI